MPVLHALLASTSMSRYTRVNKKRESIPARARIAYPPLGDHNEAIDNDRPLYGVYKALEALTAALPNGREGLGMLVGLGGKAAKKYVDDVMQTAQLTRHHHDPNVQRVLTDEQCKERARILLDAFAKSMKFGSLARLVC